METRPNSSPCVVVCVFPDAIARLDRIAIELASLATRGTPELVSVDGHLDRMGNELFITLRFVDGSLVRGNIESIATIVKAAAGTLIIPSTLRQEDQEELDHRFARCAVSVIAVASIDLAMTALHTALMQAHRPAKVSPSALPPLPVMPPLVVPRTPTRPLYSSPRLSTDEVEETLSTSGAPRSSLAPNTVDVRYLRSGRWAPARLRALSVRGAYLIATGLPRTDDVVHIALGLGEHGALVRGMVFHVTSESDARNTGISGFAVRFILDEAARTQLADLLAVARRARVTIAPPPSRATVRLPVSWPITIATRRGTIRAEVQDVSSGGMFIKPLHKLELDEAMGFSVAIDDGGGPLKGQAVVKRQLGEDEAARRSLRPGYGLAIGTLPPPDAARWTQFLARIQRRTEQRVLIGAAPQRLADLTATLSAAGYTVVGCTDASALIEFTADGARRPDAVVIDSSLADGPEPPGWLESMFTARKIPCVTLQGDMPRVRHVVDQMIL